MARVYISIGSNVDPHRNIRNGIAALKERYGKLTLSSVYESRAVGFDGENFLNLVAAFDTDEDMLTLTRALRAIEAECGRERNGRRFAPRSLDLDLLLYDQAVVRENGLELPRHEITQHAFVLCPLAEIAPDFEHPVVGERLIDLWRSFDKRSQPLWPVDFNFD